MYSRKLFTGKRKKRSYSAFGRNKKVKRPRGPVRLTIPPSVTMTPQVGLLKKQSTAGYAQSLLLPEKIRDIRIPDMATHPSATVTYSYESTFKYATTGTASNTGILGYLTLGAVPYWSTVGYNATTPANYDRSPGTEICGAVRRNFNALRLVSAVLTLRYNGNEANCGGNITGCILTQNELIGDAHPGDSTVANAGIRIASATSLSSGAGKNFFDSITTNKNLSKCRGAYYGPLYNGLRMTYRPLDPDDYNFRSSWQWMDFATLSANEQGTVQPNTVGTGSLTSTAEVPHYMIFYVDPNSGNLPSFNVSITLNYEGLPKSDEIGAEMGGVYCDPVSLAYGLNMAANHPQCTAATESELTKIERIVSTL